MSHTDVVYDPFAGTRKLALIKELGYKGKIICNDLEPEYKSLNNYPVDLWVHEDAETAIIKGKIDAIVTSPTYGNRMADSHNAKDSSKRITYTHQLNRKLSSGNTGNMQWGNNYKEKHQRCYINFYKHLTEGGLFIINVSNHIRKGKEVDVVSFHIEAAIKAGFILTENIKMPVKRMRYGSNSKLRVDNEHIIVFKKQI